MTAEQRERIEAIKRERAKLATPFERIAFDNQGICTGDAGLYIIAALESGKAGCR